MTLTTLSKRYLIHLDLASHTLKTNKWFDSTRSMIITLGDDLDSPLLSHAGRCSLTLSDSLLVVHPIYDARHEHVKEYTQKLVAISGSLFLMFEAIIVFE